MTELAWFHVAPWEPGIHLVAEPGHISCWLIHGRDRSILLDTGLGLFDIAAAIAPVATSPVEVVTSHAHFDHVGGDSGFAMRWAHELARPRLDGADMSPEARRYGTFGAETYAAWQALRDADKGAFQLIGPDETMRPWPPAGADVEGWTIRTQAPTGTLADGDVIDLGDRRLRVIHTPGHAPDHVCLLDEAAGVLFAQDQAYYGAHLIYDDDADFATWAASARRLADELDGQIRTVLCAHTLRPSVPPRLLGELADAAERVLGGEIVPVPSIGFNGARCRGADFGHFELLVP